MTAKSEAEDARMSGEPFLKPEQRVLSLRNLFDFRQPRRRGGGMTDVGWILRDGSASIIWDDPQPFQRRSERPLSAKSVRLCPAAIDFDARHFVVHCPFDLNLRFKFGEIRHGIIDLAGDRSAVRTVKLNDLFMVVDQKEWRDPKRPILQFHTPYVFLSDEPVYINQMHPFLHYAEPPLPGLTIGGRFPIDVWPRGLTWAFEWHDTTKDLILRRGTPWFYVRFETQDPSRNIRLVQAEMRPEVETYIQSLASVTNYVNRTFSLFDRAKSRRPKRLLFKKKI